MKCGFSLLSLFMGPHLEIKLGNWFDASTIKKIKNRTNIDNFTKSLIFATSVSIIQNQNRCDISI